MFEVNFNAADDGSDMSRYNNRVSTAIYNILYPSIAENYPKWVYKNYNAILFILRLLELQLLVGKINKKNV